MGVPTSHTEPSSPTNLLAIQREVLGYPLYWVGHTSELMLAELLVKSSCETAESETSLRPRVSPSKRFVVVDSFFLKARRPYDTYDLILRDTWWKSTHTNNNGILLLQLIARASEHCVIRSSPCNASEQCILTILLDCMVLFMPDYLVNLVKRLRVYVKVIMKQATQPCMFKRTCNQLYYTFQRHVNAAQSNVQTYIRYYLPICERLVLRVNIFNLVLVPRITKVALCKTITCKTEPACKTHLVI